MGTVDDAEDPARRVMRRPRNRQAFVRATEPPRSVLAMRTSEAEANFFVCPDCGLPLSQDPVGKGFVKHLSRKPDGTVCRYGHGERDEPAQ